MWLLGRFLRITASFVPDILRVSAFTLVEERKKIHAAMAKARSMPNGIYHPYNASPRDIADIKRRKTNLDKVLQKTKDTKPPPDATASLRPKSQFDKDAILKHGTDNEPNALFTFITKFMKAAFPPSAKVSSTEHVIYILSYSFIDF